MSESRAERRLLLSALAAALVLLVLLALGEVAARLLVPAFQKYHPPESLVDALAEDEGDRLFVYDRLLGWRPNPGLDLETRGGDGPIRVTINREGFREAERDPSDRRPEWAVLGDSVVWGFNVEARDRFSDRLNHRLPDVRFRNYGVSGYGTTQELLLYLYAVRRHHPSGVLLLFGANDRANNLKKASRAGYARPRFTLDGRELVLENFVVPRIDALTARVPWHRSHLWDAVRFRSDRVVEDLFRVDPTHRIVQELAEIAREDGSRLVVAIEHTDDPLVRHCREIDVPVLELGPVLEAADREQPVEFAKAVGAHWTPWGHEVVARALAPFLEPMLPAPAPLSGSPPDG